MHPTHANFCPSLASTVYSAKSIPNPMKVEPKICHSTYGMICSEDLGKQNGQALVINACNGPLTPKSGQSCPHHGNYTFQASVRTPEYANKYLAKSTTRMLMRVTFAPVKDFSWYTAMYAEAEQELDANQTEAIWQEYLKAPTEAVYCHLPFTMVGDTFDLDAYYKKLETNGETKRSYYDTYYGQYGYFDESAESVGVVAVLGLLYRWRRRRQQDDEEEEEIQVDFDGSSQTVEDRCVTNQPPMKEQEMAEVRTNFVTMDDTPRNNSFDSVVSLPQLV